jgi:hypothetical protein
MMRRKVNEWYDEVDGPEDNSLMDTNHSGDVYQQDNVGTESLED